MKEFPSASVIVDPFAFAMKRGVPPTERKARTGELTPPGITFCASRNSFLETVVFIRPFLLAASGDSSFFARELYPVSRRGVKGSIPWIFKRIFRISKTGLYPGLTGGKVEVYKSCFGQDLRSDAEALGKEASGKEATRNGDL